jgi:hypothetical protein
MYVCMYVCKDSLQNVVGLRLVKKVAICDRPMLRLEKHGEIGHSWRIQQYFD